MDTNKRIFEDFPEVDCNQCEPYWNNQCDGTLVGSEKRCKAFKATRKVDIPFEIKSLESALKWLRNSVYILYAVMLIELVTRIFWGG